MSDSIKQDQAEETAVVQAAEVAPELPGKRLRDARETSHLSREEVGHHLRLYPSLIKALEEDDYGKLPSPAYICGYLRSYARLLKLDEREIVNAYTKGQLISSALIPENINIQPGKKVNYAFIKWLGITLLIAALVGAGLWLLDQPDVLERISSEPQQTTATSLPEGTDERIAQGGESAPLSIADAIRDAKEAGPELVTDEPEQQSDAATASEAQDTGVIPDSQQMASATPSASESEMQGSKNAAGTATVLRLFYRDDSWTEILDRDANRVIYRLVRKGANLTVDAEGPFTILLGNAPAVDVYFKGELFDHTRFHRNEIAYFRIGN